MLHDFDMLIVSAWHVTVQTGSMHELLDDVTTEISSRNAVGDVFAVFFLLTFKQRVNCGCVVACAVYRSTYNLTPHLGSHMDSSPLM